MATICDLSVPAHEFGLAETFQTISGAQLACEPVVASCSNSCLSLIRAHAPDRQKLEVAFTDDPTVAEWTRLTDQETSWLYRIEWATRVSLVRRMLTGEGATVLSAIWSCREWALQVLYPSREACSEINTVCEKHDLSITIDAIRTVNSKQSMCHGLTDAQQTALVQAYEMGYFTVPREVDLDTVAETLDISHQALSERLRRAHRTLIETTLCRQGWVQDTDTVDPVPADSLAMHDSQPLPMD